ncbi:MAG: membrane protein insertion efficiency factor YidD [candidate division Zixibacteria bacterium]|nr:membrane protein insertion efficiency factor YidD [candidate division Zixibacteria bacterium]
MNRIVLLLIKIYQYTLGTVLPRSCRFHPSCSEYSIQAFRSFGIFRGSWISLKRILRCNPFNPGGYDPIIRDDS